MSLEATIKRNNELLEQNNQLLTNLLAAQGKLSQHDVSAPAEESEPDEDPKEEAKPARKPARKTAKKAARKTATKKTPPPVEESDDGDEEDGDADAAQGREDIRDAIRSERARLKGTDGGAALVKAHQNATRQILDGLEASNISEIPDDKVAAVLKKIKAIDVESDADDEDDDDLG